MAAGLRTAASAFLVQGGVVSRKPGQYGPSIKHAPARISAIICIYS